MRRLVALVSVVVFVDAMLFGTLIPLIPGYVTTYGLSKLEAGVLVSAFGAGALVGAIPGGVVAGRYGPRRAVVVGLGILGVASLSFALAGSPVALGLARFVQGFSSALTWAGALAWLTVSAPKARRGEMVGTAFAFAVLGALLGPMIGALAKVVSIRLTFAVVAVGALGLSAFAATQRDARPESPRPGAVRRAAQDPAFGAGLWLSLLPAFFFGVVDVLAPLTLDAGGWGAVAIGLVFFFAALGEVALNPLVGRVSDRRGRLFPVRIALFASIAAAVLLATAEEPIIVAILVMLGSITFGALFTPGMALVSDRSERAGLTQGLGFGASNSAWAVGALVGPAFGGAVADSLGDAAPYLCCATLSLVTLILVVARPNRQPRTA